MDSSRKDQILLPVCVHLMLRAFAVLLYYGLFGQELWFCEVPLVLLCEIPVLNSSEITWFAINFIFVNKHSINFTKSCGSQG